MTGRSPRNHWPMVGLLLLVFVAASLGRCAPLLTNYFSMDQTRDLEAAHAILAGDAPPAGPRIGQSDYRLGTLYYRVVACGVALFHSEMGALPILRLLSVLGVLLWTVWMAKVAPSIGVVRVGALALAFHGFAILAARQLWNPALISATSGIFALGAAFWTVDRRGWGLGVAAVGAALMAQAHAMTVVLLPLVFAAGKPTLPVWGVAVRSVAAWIGLVLAAAISAPWIAYDVGVWLDGSDALAFYASTETDRAPFAVAFARALAFESYLTARVVVGGDAWRVAVEVASYAFAAFVAMGTVALIARRRALGIAVALSIVAAAAIAAAPSHSTYAYYLEPVIPLRALAFGVGVVALVQRCARCRVVGVPVIGLALVTVGLPFAHWVRGAFDADRTGVISGADLDLRAPPGGTPEPINRFPAYWVKYKVGYALAWHGYDHDALARLGRGPWWPAFVDDGGRFLHDGRIQTDAPVLLAHDSVPVPLPAERQRLAMHDDMFDVIPFRSAIDHDTVDVETGGRIAIGLAWWRVTARVWERPTATFGFRFDGRVAGSDRVRFVVTTAFGVRIDAVALGGRPATRSGRWARQGVESVAFDVDARASVETLSIALDASGALGKPIFLNVYDVWR